MGVHESRRRELYERVTTAADGLNERLGALWRVHRESTRYGTDDVTAVQLAIFAAHGWSGGQPPTPR